MDLSYSENLIISNWDKLCRICLTDGTILFPVIKIDSLDEQYKMRFCDMLNTCSGLDYSSKDGFPQLICSLCITHMYNALEFRTKCKSSEHMLTKLFRMKEDINNIIKIEAKDYDTDEVIDEPKNIVITDILKVESTSTSDNNKTKKKMQNVDSKINNTLINTHTCLICRSSYSSNVKLARHKKTHSTTCWDCYINFNTAEEYKEHIKIHVKKPEKKHEEAACAECGKVFKNKKQYKAHQLIHSKDKHLCTICGKELSTPSALNSHIKIHTGKKNYECEYCGRQFLHWSARRYHVRSVHTLEKPYACDFCDKRFTDKNSLIKHVRSHTGEKPFNCTLCDMKFADRSVLRVHMFKHTGEKRIYCQVCGKGFTKSSGLKTHMVTHTGERNHVCMVCGKAFTQAHVLRSHMKHHPEVEKSTDEVHVKIENGC